MPTLSINEHETQMALTKVSPDAGAQIIKAAGAADGLVSLVGTLTIKDEASREHAVTLRAGINGELKRIDEMRVALVKPLNDHVKWINSGFKPATTALTQALAAVEEKLRVDRREQERLAEEERKRVEREAEKVRKEAEAALLKEAKDAGLSKKDAQAFASGVAAQIETPAPYVAPAPKTLRGAGGAKVTFKKRWTYAVENAAKVPREYLVIDSGKVRDAIANGVRSIAGLRIFEDEDMAG